jgi:hypothetical protein
MIMPMPLLADIGMMPIMPIMITGMVVMPPVACSFVVPMIVSPIMMTIVMKGDRPGL